MANETDLKTVRVTIETPRWSFAKYALTENGGHIEFVSPLPCPFNYGFVKGTIGGDGLPLDAIVFGTRLHRGQEIELPVVAVVQFVDAGEQDDKLVCSATGLSSLNLVLLKVGFRIYVVMKRVVNFLKKKHRPTQYRGVSPRGSQIAETK